MINKTKMQNKKTLNEKGFTLVELIVVMAIFLFVIGAALSIFISIIKDQRRVLAEQQFLNQVSYAEEYISKGIRMAKAEVNENCLIDSEGNDHPGYIYLLTHPHPNGQSYKGIKFINQSGIDASGGPICEEFFLDRTGDGNPVLKELQNNGINGPAVALTPANLQIDSVRFLINGSSDSYVKQCIGTDPCVQPRVTMIMEVKIAGDNDEPMRTIQTTLSQRNLNVK